MDIGKQFSAKERIKIIEQYFPGDRLISGRTDNPLAPVFPRSQFPPPPHNFFLWGYLKDRVYEDNTPTIERLKGNIKCEIRIIPADMMVRVIDNFNVRVAAVIQQRGAWIDHVINY